MKLTGVGKMDFGMVLSATRRRRLALITGPWMFWLAVAFLFLIAVILVAWVDVPRVSYESRIGLQPNEVEETEMGQINSKWDEYGSTIGKGAACLALFIWPFFVLESVFVLLTCRRSKTIKHWRWYRGAIMLIPPLRLCARHPDLRGRIWLPKVRWHRMNERLKRRIEHDLSGPMIIVALLILPILVIEWTMRSEISSLTLLRLTLHIGTGVIWFSFALEYILMISLARKKWDYFKSHWVDLIIIILPLVSFIRSWRLLQVLRLSKFAKIEQLSRILRLYRLRGISMRMLRALMVLEILHRVFGQSLEKKREALLDQLSFYEEEMAELKKQLAQVEHQISAKKALVPQGKTDHSLG